MQVEWQVKDYSYFSLNGDYKVVVLGDEGCVYRALNPKCFQLFKELIANNVAIRYLTPIIPQKYIYKIYQFINEMTKIGRFKVTFNDYGLLYLCMDLIKSERIIPVFGRILTRSIIDCQWHEKLLEGENNESFDLVINYSFADSKKISFLKKLSIKEIEININKKKLDYFKECNISVTGYSSNAIIAAGRICYSARWYGLNLPDCINDHRCRNKLDIDIKEMWGKNRLMYETPSKEMIKYYKEHYIEGNVVYKQLEKNINEEDLNQFDNYIIPVLKTHKIRS